MGKKDDKKAIHVRHGSKGFIITTNIFSIAVPLFAFTVAPALGIDLKIITVTDKEIVLSNNSAAYLYVLIWSFISIILIVANSILSTKDCEIISKKDYENFQKKADTISANNKILTGVLDSLDELCRTKNQNLRKAVKATPRKSYKGMIVTHPEMQLQQIFTSHMPKLLENFISIEHKSISVSAAYRISNSDWKWLSGCEPIEKWDVNQLAKEKRSVFYELISSNKGYILYNSKKEASTNEHYYFSEEEKADDLDGSIIGRRVRIGDYNKPSAEIVFFFTTTNNILFCPDRKNSDLQVKDLKTKLDTNFFREFDERIRIEFSLFFLNGYL